MTRPNKRDIEQAVNDLDDPSPVTDGDPRLEGVKSIIADYPDCDFDAAIALLDELPDAE